MWKGLPRYCMRGKNGRDYPCFYMLLEPNLVDTSCENALCLADSFGLSVSSRLLICGQCT